MKSNGENYSPSLSRFCKKINKSNLKVAFFILLEAPNGFEPMIRQLQCHALPLGYGAIYEALYYNVIYVFSQ